MRVCVCVYVSQVINKFNDILEQFLREIETTAQIFDKHKDKPPVTKNQPPVAGAIKWARSLLARVKQTMQKLSRTEDDIIRTTDIGQRVEQAFRTFAKSIMLYEKRWFSTWSESINGVAMQHLKQAIFKRSAETGRVVVNFSGDLVELIRETRYLDRMGFSIPEIALNVALQVRAFHAHTSTHTSTCRHTQTHGGMCLLTPPACAHVCCACVYMLAWPTYQIPDLGTSMRERGRERERERVCVCVCVYH